MKKKWEIIILTVIALALGIGVFSPVFSQWDGDGAFGSVVDYLKQVAASIWPSANNTYDLGSASKQWRNIYTANGINFNGTWQNSAATSASSSGNAGAVQLAGAGGTFSGNFANLAVSGGTFYADAYALNGQRNYNYQWYINSSQMLFYADYPLSMGWPSENILQFRSTGLPQGIFEWYMDDPFGTGSGGAKSEILLYTTTHLGATTKFNSYVSPTPAYLNNANASSGNFIGYSMGMETQLANAAVPFVRIHSLKGNAANNAVTTPETIPSFEIGDLGNQTALPANADNGSLVVDRHIAALEGGAANGACCFMADGKTLGHCTGLVGANGTCTCAD